MSYATTSIVSSTPIHPSIGWNNAWIQVDNNADRDLFAQAIHVVNFDELVITLSAGDFRLGSIEINDPTNINSKATIDAATSSLNVKINNSDYSTSTNQFTEINLLSTQLLMTSADDAIIITLLKTLTSYDVRFNTTYNTQTTLFRNLTSNTNTTNTLLRILTSDDVTFNTIYNTQTTLFRNLTSNTNTTNTLLQTLTSTNPVTAVEVLNPVTAVEVLNPVTAVEVLNPVTAVEVLNPVTAVEILNPVTAVEILNPVTAVEILNPVTAVEILNPVTAVEVLNPVTAVEILNPVTAVEISNVVGIPAYPIVKEWGVLEVILPRGIEITLTDKPASVVSILNYTGEMFKVKNTYQGVYFQVLNNFAFDIDVVNNTNEITLLQTTSSDFLTAQFVYTKYV